jgi:lambda family phage tail tape measure protein
LNKSDVLETISDQFDNLAFSAIGSMIDQLAAGELKIREFTATFLRQTSLMIAKQLIFNAIRSAIPGGFGRLLFGAAGGAAFGAGGVQAFAKGAVVNGPTPFGYSGGLGVMGEAGPEAIMPLSRDSRGNLGVSAPRIEVNNYGNDQIQVTESELVVRIAVGQARKAVQNDFSRSMSTGQGVYARGLESGYTARRRNT